MAVVAAQVMLGWAVGVSEDVSPGLKAMRDTKGASLSTMLWRLLPQDPEIRLVVSPFLAISQCPPRTRLSLAGRPPSFRAAHLEYLYLRGIALLDVVDLRPARHSLRVLSAQALL